MVLDRFTSSDFYKDQLSAILIGIKLAIKGIKKPTTKDNAVAFKVGIGEKGIPNSFENKLLIIYKIPVEATKANAMAGNT